ncbi:MAG: glycosyltransferase [Bacteroidota bacterium]
MAKRLKIGLIYSYNKDWVAGAYYILNLIHALKLQSDENKPELTILSYSSDELNMIKQTSYPYLKFHQLYEKDFWVSYTLFERIVNKIKRVFGGKNIFYREQTYKRLKIKLDLLFPSTKHVYFSKVKNKLFWIPDFQEHFLPQFFSEQEISTRKMHQKMLADNSCSIVFSSNNALKHFKTLYPHSKSKTYVLQFAVTHPSYKNIPTDLLFSKYDIHQPYFFCPNQVWAHKNHITILKAIKNLNEQGQDNMLVIFSGKESDYRNPYFFSELKKYITDNMIEDYVKFLGFIDREDQLQLMNHSICIIQPSLFEGWSTVIEDAKSMEQYIIASDIEVHQEQLLNNVTFFNPVNIDQLAATMRTFLNNPPTKTINDYDNNVLKFGKTFTEIVKKEIM